MSFKKLIKLNSYSTNAFLMKELISLIENRDQILEDNARRLLKEALNYISLIKSGNEYLELMRGENEIDNNRNLPEDDLEESLDAYTNSVKALMRHGEVNNSDRINEIFDTSEREIRNAINQPRINTNNLQEAHLLFDSIRSFLLTKANELSKEKKTIFKVH